MKNDNDCKITFIKILGIIKYQLFEKIEKKPLSPLLRPERLNARLPATVRPCD